jgi:hypothetical protein
MREWMMMLKRSFDTNGQHSFGSSPFDSDVLAAPWRRPPLYQFHQRSVIPRITNL